MHYIKRNHIRSAYLTLVSLVAVAFVFGQPRAQKPEYKKYNPSYHFYPSGDPTGLFYLGGQYYNNWGTAYSSDLIYWKRTKSGSIRQRLQDSTLSVATRDSLRVRLAASRLGGSGTIVVDWNNTSGFGKDGKPPIVSIWHNDTQPWGNQVVGIAYSNDTAMSWTRYEKFPVLDVNNREFRDPLVFWYEPTKNWVMAIGLAEASKVKFFKSSNLKEWIFMSEFGPWGSVDGVWECADFFPLPVDGNPDKIKWVLAVSIQPLSGQYFIGDFDGKRFTLDSSYVLDLSYDKYLPRGKILFDFEKGLDSWVIEGEAFNQSPSNQALNGQGAVRGYFGRYFLNSQNSNRPSQGRLLSPSFTIDKPFLNFLAGGQHDLGKQEINLIVDNKKVSSQSGNNPLSFNWGGGLLWCGWDVSEFLGKEGRIEIKDSSNGYILADQFMLCEEMASTDREKAFWIDYGPDFYAVRSWMSYAENEKRRIWTGWMGSWRYAGDEPVRGLQTVPRSVELKTFPEGIRLVQNPIKETESLRSTSKSATEIPLEGIWKADKIKPSKNNYELVVEIQNIDAEEFGLKLGVGNNQHTLVGYNVSEEKIYVDRRKSGLISFSDLFPQKNSGPLKNRTNTLKLHIFVDNSSVEVFANNGETVISSKIYPDGSSTGIEFFSNKGKIIIRSIKLWELKSILLD
jgi:fructan beta-fructosidase